VKSQPGKRQFSKRLERFINHLNLLLRREEEKQCSSQEAIPLRNAGSINHQEKKREKKSTGNLGRSPTEVNSLNNTTYWDPFGVTQEGSWDYQGF